MPAIGDSLAAAAAVLAAGGVVALPTETSYGLAVDPGKEAPLRRLYALKKRPPNKPLSLVAADTNQLYQVITTIPPCYEPLMERFWPGPLTLIFPARADIHPLVRAADGTVAVRISSHPAPTTLSSLYGSPLTATSANLAGGPPRFSAHKVAELFGDEVDYIFDAAPYTPIAQCSTIVGVKNGELVLHRGGAIDFTDICLPNAGFM
jgi:L-threonylcarbamoyladenylate synthase